jgi:hypothetical protein
MPYDAEPDDLTADLVERRILLNTADPRIFAAAQFCSAASQSLPGYCCAQCWLCLTGISDKRADYARASVTILH